MVKHKWFFILFFFSFCCAPRGTVEEPFDPSILTQPVDKSYQLTEFTSHYLIQINAEKLPPRAAVMEVTYNNEYYGYFTPDDIIRIPKDVAVKGADLAVTIYDDNAVNLKSFVFHVP